MADRLGPGKQYFSDLLSRLPEGSRATVEEAFSADDAAPALEYLGEGVLSRSDYSRAMNDLKTSREEVEAWKRNLDAWFETNKAKLTAAPTPTSGDPSRPAPSPTGLTKKEMEEMLTEREMAAAAYMNTITPLTVRHFQAFGEVLDPNTLLKHPQVRELGITGVYDLLNKDRYDAKAKAAEDERITKIVNERVAEERKKFLSSPPHMVAPMEGSPLDALEDPNAGKAQFSVQAAVDEYTRLVAEKQLNPA